MALSRATSGILFLAGIILLASHAWAATLDVYTLKNISFPNVYDSTGIFASITIDNNRPDLTGNTPAENITISMRDGSGTPVSAWGVRTFSLPDFSSGKRQTMQVDIQPAGSVPFLNVGETYTLYATIESFSSETETSNNKGYQTFTVLATPQTFSIPDFPAWMSVLTLSVVLGWMFFSARKGRSI